MRRFVTITSIALAAATIAALTGCTGESIDTPTVVAIDSLSAPASMVPTEPYVTFDDTVLPAVGDLPWLVAGDVAAPGEASAPVVWTSSDGGTWDSHPVAEGLDGSFSGTLAGDDTLAVIVGTLWTAGVQSTLVFTSDDRTTWSPAALPEELATEFRIGQLAVSDGTVIAVGTNAAGASAGIRIDGEKVDRFDVPAVSDGELLAPFSLTWGESLVLAAYPGVEGEPNPSVSFVSDDAGASWSTSAEIAPADASVAGVAAVEGGYVATGSTPKNSEPGAASIPAAWFSADGKAWTAESVPQVSDGVFFYSDNSSVGFGAPNANAGAVATIAWNDNSAYSGVFRRAASGEWGFVSESTANSGNGIGGVAIPINDTSTLSVIGTSGYARISTIASENGWIDAEVIAQRNDIDYVDAIYPGEQSPEMTLGRANFTLTGTDGWRNTTSVALAKVGEKSVDIADWNPERVAALSGVQLASDEEGAHIVIGVNFAEGASTILAEGWFRASDDAEWTPIAGFEGAGATNFVGAMRAGDTWYAWGDYRDSSSYSDPSHALLWSSTDGVTWTRAAGDFGSGALESQLSDVCALPDGTAVGVGWVEEAGSTYSPTVWMLEGDQWIRADIGDLGSQNGYGESCATGEDGIVANAYLNGRSTLQLTTNGTDWTEVFRAERGIDFGTPVAVPGGFAASGQLVDGNFSGPVVWLSADGDTWAPVSIPSFRTGTTSAVAAFGDDLLVTMSGRIGTPVSVVRDIEKVIADNAG